MRVLLPADIPHLTATEVQCKTVGELVADYFGGNCPMLLAIDAEGYEAEIIPSVNFDQHTFQAVLFEHHSLGGNRQSVESHLRRSGFSLQALGGDTLATRDRLPHLGG